MRINRGSIAVNLAEQLDLQSAGGGITPTECKSDVQPVVIVPRNRPVILFKSTAGNLAALSATRQFWMTGLSLGCTMAVGDLSTYVYCYVVQGGATKIFHMNVQPSLTFNKDVQFTTPIPLDKGSVCSCGGNNTVTLVTLSIVGYYDD